MKIHEYQGKAILREYGVEVPDGLPAFSIEDAVKVLTILYAASSNPEYLTDDKPEIPVRAAGLFVLRSNSILNKKDGTCRG